jgi:hypothetical protein
VTLTKFQLVSLMAANYEVQRSGVLYCRVYHAKFYINPLLVDSLCIGSLTDDAVMCVSSNGWVKVNNSFKKL